MDPLNYRAGYATDHAQLQILDFYYYMAIGCGIELRLEPINTC